MKIYVASSWQNTHHDFVVTALRGDGHEVYDFRQDGFSWQQVDAEYAEITELGYSRPKVDLRRWHRMTSTKMARDGFKRDFDAMKWADAFVLVLPCGRSAHLEAGWAAGAGKRLVVYMPEPQEPDLMYLMAHAIVGNIAEVLGCLRAYEAKS